MRITFHEILVISPFLSGGVIRDFNDRNTRSLINDARYMLITREMSLGRLKPEDVSHFQIYTMRDAVIDGETAISDEAQEIQKQDIHAKIVPFPVSWTVKMKKKQKETQDILSYHTQAAGCSDKARAKASGGRQPIEECGRTGL